MSFKVTPDRFIDVPVVVRFGDTDPYGVVYFASYFRYLHRGVEEFLRHGGLDPRDIFRNTAEGFGLPVVAASCQFRKPVWYGESLTLRVTVAAMGRSSLTFGFRFYRSGEETAAFPLAEGELTVTTIDREWKTRPLPDNVRHAATPFSADDPT